MRQLVVVATILLATACGGPTTPPVALPTDRRRPSNLAVRRPAPGTTTRRYRRNPAGRSDQVQQGRLATRRTPAGTIPSARISVTSTSTPRGRWMPAAPARRSDPRRRRGLLGARKSLSTSGQPVKLGQPLDWVAITDHSDMMGMITEIKGGNPEMMADPTLKRWRDMFNGGPVEAKKGVMELVAAQAEQEAAAGRDGSEVCQERLGQDHLDRGEVQRAGALHGVHRATSGRRTPAAATTCIGTSSTATTRTRPTRCCRTPRSRARTPKTSGSG